MTRALLHVEDDPILARVVRHAFASFGFTGEFFSTSGVAEALAFISRRKTEGGPLDLILVDMQLPDGTGLDVLRVVKSNPAWATTPVIFLSGEMSPDLIGEAYALGANCFLSKCPREGDIIDAVRSLYACWFQAAVLPPHTPPDPVRERLARAVSLRSRSGDFYNRLASSFSEQPELMGFWLDRALSESNLANLCAFLLSQTGRTEPDDHSLRHISMMQDQVDARLRAAESRLGARPMPTSDEAYAWVLEVVDNQDEEAFAEAIALLFPVAPAAARALKARFAIQLADIGGFVSHHADDPKLRARAEGLVRTAERLMALPDDAPPAECSQEPKRSAGSN